MCFIPTFPPLYWELFLAPITLHRTSYSSEHHNRISCFNCNIIFQEKQRLTIPLKFAVQCVASSICGAFRFFSRLENISGQLFLQGLYQSYQLFNEHIYLMKRKRVLKLFGNLAEFFFPCWGNCISHSCNCICKYLGTDRLRVASFWFQEAIPGKKKWIHIVRDQNHMLSQVWLRARSTDGVLCKEIKIYARAVMNGLAEQSHCS